LVSGGLPEAGVPGTLWRLLRNRTQRLHPAWSERPIQLYEIEDNIGNFLSDRKEQYDFIHLSHVIEHIPKYSLLWVVDALYRALKPGGVLMLRTPNMEGPCANSSLYVTLAHEYGFCGSNLESLLDICGFDDVRFHGTTAFQPTLKQRGGALLRRIFLRKARSGTACSE
jgi:SAM-dependent methyltransferase